MRALLALAALLAACGPAAPVPEGGGGLSLRAEPVRIAPGELTGMTLLGTQILRADHPEFGGLSGLAIRDGMLHAVTDQGWWLEAALVDGPEGLGLAEARLVALRDAGGAVLDKEGGDAEGIAWRGGWVISFERDHRLMTLGADGRLGAPVRAPGFETLGSNQGLEALATLPDGRLLAIAEAAGDGTHPMFTVAADGSVTEHRLAEDAPFSVTGADVGPDGRLYTVRRHFSPATGVSIRVHRYALGPDGLPIEATRQQLADYRSASGIDNMEAIALWQDAAGRTRLALVSDDNFSAVQRTLLMDFVLE